MQQHEHSELAKRTRDAGTEAINSGADPADTVEALMVGALSVARLYMPPGDVAKYLRFVADQVEPAAEAMKAKDH